MKTRVSDDTFAIIFHTGDKPRELVEAVAKLVLWLHVDVDMDVQGKMIVVKQRQLPNAGRTTDAPHRP